MKIIVYSKPNCGACDITKQWLDSNNLEYTSINAYEDKKAMAEIQERGFMSFPVVNVDDWERSWSGFDYQKLSELL